MENVPVLKCIYYPRANAAGVAEIKFHHAPLGSIRFIGATESNKDRPRNDPSDVRDFILIFCIAE